MRSLNTLLRSGLLAGIVLAMAADAQATIYFVNPSGNDKNSGTSVVTPFRTIKQAAKVIRNGDTVYVAPGTYTDEIIINGIQGASLPAVFIGNSGATVNAQWKVVNSNNVQIKGFTFRDGGAKRLLVWKGSYEGLIQDCTFDAGSQGLLVNSGSLTIEDSQITNFAQEGIQVDGESRLIVRDSTISGCQKSGLEIRKVANVIFENCDVKDNLGNGINVNFAIDSFDTGPDGSSWNGKAPLAGSDGVIDIASGAQIYGDVHHRPENPVDPSGVTGTINELDPAITFPPVDPGDAATNNNNASIPLSDKGKQVLLPGNQFSLGGNDGVSLQPGTYYFSSLSSNSPIRVSGLTIVYVTGNVDLKDITNLSGDPRNLQLYVMGGEIKIHSSAAIQAAIYAPNAAIKILGSSEIRGMVLAKSLDMNGTSKVYTDPSLQSLSAALFPGPPSSPSPPSSWNPVSSGALDISSSEFTDNGNGVRIITEQAFNTRGTDFSHNAGWGLSLFGTSQIEDCKLNDNAIGGVRLQSVDTADLTVHNLTLADNIRYGIFAADCGLTFDSTNIGEWKISGSQIAIMGEASNLAFDQVAISGGSVAAVQCDQGSMNAVRATFTDSGYGLLLSNCDAVLDQCTFSGNTVGLYANQNRSLLVKNSTMTNNSVWGATVYGGGSAGATTIEGCTIHQNAGGLSIVNAVDGQVLLRAGTALRDNTDAGLHFAGCDMTVNDQAAHGWQITGNNYGISSDNSTLVFDGLTIHGNTNGAWLTSSNVTMTNSTFTGSTYGLWATNNNSLDVRSSTFSGNSSYGVHLQGPGSIRFCSITGNGSGLYLNATDVTDANLTGTDISGNSLYGVYSYNASLALTSQASEGWSIDSNGYNISGYQADISLVGAKMTNATNYGVMAEYGSLNLQQSTITSNAGGVRAFFTTAFTVDQSLISGSSTGSWAVVNLDGGLTMRNSVVAGAQSGVYSSSPSKPATIYNTTIADASLYGVHVYDGDLTVMNTIISGTGGTYGLYREPSANLAHSYNLIFGFAVPFENTTADATEVLDPPQFTDAANGDYSLAKGSPAINAGTDLSASHTIDMLSNPRPSRKVFEIGAYEYMKDGGSLRVLNWKEER